MKKQILASILTTFLSSHLGAVEAPKAAEAPKTYKAEVVLSESNTIVFRDVFTVSSTAQAMVKARELDAKLPKDAVIYLIINSPGGDIDAGIELIENMNSLNHKVITLTQFAASMGFQTVQGVSGERLILANGTLMAHRARGGFAGEFAPNGGQLNTRFQYYLKRIERMDKRAVERTKGKLNLKEYQELVRDEYWCDGQDCVDKGFADKVVNATCDESFAGTKEITTSMSFMGMSMEIKAEIANCPLITGPLKAQANARVYLDGKEYNETTFNSIKSEKLREYVIREFEKTRDELSQIAGGIYRNAERY